MMVLVVIVMIMIMVIRVLGALRVLPPGCDCDQGVFLVLLPGYGGDCGDRNDNGYCIV